jgi:hypothetical protein
VLSSSSPALSSSSASANRPSLCAVLAPSLQSSLRRAPSSQSAVAQSLIAERIAAVAASPAINANS